MTMTEPPPYCARKYHLVGLPGQLLGPFVVPFAKRVGRRFYFQDDNARAHRARIVNVYLPPASRHLPNATSPDLSPTLNTSGTW